MSITITLMNLFQTFLGVILAGLTAIVFALAIWWWDGVPKQMRWRPRQFVPVWLLCILLVGMWILWVTWIF